MAELNDRPTKIRKIDAETEIPPIPSQEPASQDLTTITASSLVADVSPEPENQADDTAIPQISKNQLKKLKKRERWEASREQRTIKRREKHKEKQARKAKERAELEARILSGEIPAPKPDDDDDDDDDGDVKKKHIPRPKQVPVGLILDTDFNEFMTEKEIISLGAQLTRCYSLNKAAQYRAHLAVSSWGGVLQTRFQKVLANTHLSWHGVSFFEDKDFVAAGHFLHDMMAGCDKSELAGALAGTESEKTKETEMTTARAASTSDQQPVEPMSVAPSIVYLTSDSPHVLIRLEPNTSYIIGGIVDKNRHKGICYKRACERGIPTAKLPIGQYMKMQSRTVLAVNHVVEIMLKWLETGDWGEAFLRVIPKRKQAQLRTTKTDAATDTCSDDNDDNDRNSCSGTHAGKRNTGGRDIQSKGL
ncbi:hypothetical protein K3495_g3344 [Podosphaera aphanis]|nr:hypothetical protein K3495_g3344 [Podosphaera aphanis]